jgi:antitoxin (DNA-binding transcriptional repressor) of toxin-antitoxin stability system
MQASIRELRLHTKELFDAAQRGEKVYVTCRNQNPIQLVPVKNKTVIKESDVFGMWKDNRDVTNIDDFINQLRRSRHHAD